MAGVFGALAWSFTTLSVVAKNRLSSVRGFIALETAFTVAQFLVVSPRIAAHPPRWPHLPVTPETRRSGT
ncbi:MAG: hypothetical protein AB7O24_17415 [Kofleriaceae bacterium]